MKATLARNDAGQIFWQTDRPLDAMPLGDYVHVPTVAAPADDEHPDVLAYVRATTAHLEPDA